MIKKRSSASFLLSAVIGLLPFSGPALALDPDFNKVEQFFSRMEHTYKDYANLGIRLVSKDEVYLGAIPFFKEALTLKTNKEDKVFDKYLDLLVQKAGREQFRYLPVDLLQKSNAPSIRYILAEIYFKKNNWKEALSYLENIPRDHYIYPNVLFLRGSIYNFKEEQSKAMSEFVECIKYSDKAQGAFGKDPVLKRIYQYTRDTCEIAIARVFYKNKDYKRSQFVYRKISKRSYKWPNFLLEDAWNSYILKDYNRTIGRLLTFQAPIFENYFFAEAETLKTMGYIHLCLWDEAVNSIKRYQKLYVPSGIKLVEFLKEPFGDEKFFLKLAITKDHPRIKDFEFLRRIIGNAKKNPYFFTNLYYLEEFSHEFAELKKRTRSSPLQSVILANVLAGRNAQSVLLNQYVKKSLFYTANEMVATSETLNGILLDLYSLQKELTYRKKDLKSIQADESKIDIARESNQQFWRLKREFWADELGDYVLADKSRCKAGDMEG
jgi:tetratricopeptide (TPR) repeat protein